MFKHTISLIAISILLGFSFCSKSKTIQAQSHTSEQFVKISAADSAIQFTISGKTSIQLINGKINIAVFGEGNMLFQIVEIPYNTQSEKGTYSGENFSAILMKPKEPSCFTRKNINNNTLTVEKLPENKIRFVLKALLICGDFPFELEAQLEGEIPEEIFLEEHHKE